MYVQKIILIVLFLIISANNCLSQHKLKFANLGDFKTTNGEIIRDCQIGYRTIGKLNDDKSNVVLWSTWFTGTTENIVKFGLVDNLINPDGLYIILVDALSNGVSSSPSNTKNFPEVTIRDMVNSQHKLLVDHLGIDHIYTVMGFSLGGMQALEWAVAYPEFADKVISIAGTPKLTSRDKLLWKTMADLIEPNSEKDNYEAVSDFKNAHNIFLMNLSSPNFMTSSIPVDSLDNYLKTEYENLMEPEDYLGGIRAILSYDIYKGTNSNPIEIKDRIKADVLLISASQDHMLNPKNSINLSKTAGYKSVILTTDCGHIAPFCESNKIRDEISKFLRE